ncbi:MAG: hypothetical protein ABI887_14485 [Burkholderiales bacterium]
MRRAIVALMLVCGAVSSAPAQVSVGVGVALPGVSIGINIPAYPQLVRVPSYPVYYAPGLQENLFFYDGMYWVYESDSWYASSWYNGPWSSIQPEYVPVYVLRVPVRYYRRPPVYFRGWRPDAPPRWGDHWGPGWEQHHRGWDRWNRGAAPAPAPLPLYQRQYRGDRYPAVERQRYLQSQNYRYQPRDAVVRQHVEAGAAPRARATAAPRREIAPREGRPGRQDVPRAEAPMRRAPPVATTSPRAIPPPPGRDHVERSARPPERAPQVRAAPPEQQVLQRAPARSEPPAARPVQAGPEPAARVPQAHGRGQGQGPPRERERERGEGRGQDSRN